MVGISSEDSGAGSSTEGFSSGQQLCEAGEVLSEWRSSEQLENGTPSTSPPYWDTDDNDDFGRLFAPKESWEFLNEFFRRHAGALPGNELQEHVGAYRREREIEEGELDYVD